MASRPTVRQMEAEPEQDLDVVRHLLDRLVDPNAGEGVLLVVGDAGMGKTHLVHRLAQAVRATGGNVGWCQCNQALGGPPLWEWRSAIGEIDLGIESSFPGTGELEVFQSVWQWLESTADARPTLLVLDDLHDASSSTIDLFEQLGRRPRSGPWMVVASARSGIDRLDELQVPRTVLFGIDRAGALRIADAVEVALTPERADELIHFTGGNPLFIRRILETDADGLDMSPALLSLISSSIGELDPSVRPVAEALSVLGTSSARSMLRLMVGPDAWPTTLITDHALIVEGDDIAFRHPLLREVVYEHLDDERRSWLHARAAYVIEQMGGSSSLAAVHWSRAALAGQGRVAADTALRAGHLAMDMAVWADAITHFSHASAVLDQLDDVDDRAASGAYRARALSMNGEIGAGLRAILESLPQRGDPRVRVSLQNRQLLARELVRLRWREEPNPSILDPGTLMRTAETLLGVELDPTSRSMIIAVTVVAGEIDGLQELHAEAAQAALDALPADAGPIVRGEAHLTLRRALMAIPHSAERRTQASKAAVAASRESGDVELTGRSLRMLLTDAMASGDRPLALSAIAAFDTAATAALREHQALGQAGLATIEGRYADASDILDAAVKELSYVGREAPSLEFVRAILALDQGGLSSSLAQYEPLLAIVADASLRSAFAFAAASDGQSERAVELVDSALELLVEASIDPLRPISLAMAAEAAIVIGHPACDRLLSMMDSLEGSCVTPANSSVPWLGSADRLIGLLRARCGDLEGAERAVRSSLATHRRMQAKPWTARSLVALGSVLRAAGREAEADACFAEADAIVAELAMVSLPVPVLGRTPEPARAAESAGQIVHLERVDRGWIVRSAGEAGHLLRNLAGLGQIALLVAQPGREWHVLDLVGAAAGSALPSSDAGVILDDRARRAYQARMAGLRVDLDEAENRADLERAASLRLEVDAIESELLRAFGLGGRSRRMGDASERARINVRRNLRRAIDAIDQVDAGLGDHLRHRVVTGRFCSYRPSMSDPTTWSVQW